MKWIVSVIYLLIWWAIPLRLDEVMEFPRHSIFPDMPHLQPHPQRLLFPQYFPPRMVFPHQYGGGSGPGRLHYLPPAANFTHQMPLHPYLVSGGRALQCLSDLSCLCMWRFFAFCSALLLLCVLEQANYFPHGMPNVSFVENSAYGPLLPKVPKVLWNRFCCFQIENVMVWRLIGSNCSRVPQCTGTHLLRLDELVFEAWRKMPWTKPRWCPCT